MTAPRYGSISAVGNRVTAVTRRSIAGMRSSLCCQSLPAAPLKTSGAMISPELVIVNVAIASILNACCGVRMRNVAIGTSDRAEM
jgi:hypothetical protein